MLKNTIRILMLCLILVLIVGCDSKTSITPTPAVDTQVPPTATLQTIAASPLPTATIVPLTSTPLSTSTPLLPISTSTPAYIPLPTLSGNGGGVIAFVSERSGNRDLYLMNADGTEVQQLTTHASHDAWASWSPDGAQIVFMAERYGRWNIFKLNIDQGEGSVQSLTTMNMNYEPAWSPDGSWIAFCSNRDGNAEIYLMDPSGRNQRRLTTHHMSDLHPSWSPDGTQIAFISDRDGDLEIYLMPVPGVGKNVDEGDIQRLTNNDASDWSPRWSPDGTQIVFTSDRDGDMDIYVLTVLGMGTEDEPVRGQRRLTENDVDDFDPHWSPDGSRIAFSREDDGNMDIYIMKADGSDLQQLTTNPADDYGPVWQPIPLAILKPESLFSLEKSDQEFSSEGTYQIGLADLDNDGDLDGIFANPLTHDSQIWLNDGTGYFADTGQRLTQYGHGVGIADFDSDGDLDAFIACHYFFEPSKIYINNGNTVFQDSGQNLGDANMSGTDLNLVDLNDDGNVDVHVVYYDPEGETDKVYLNDGQGVFTDSGLTLNEDVIAWGDLDSDGDVDLFGKIFGEGYVVMLNDGNGKLSQGWGMEDNLAIYGDVSLGDFDGDGDLDALVANGFREDGSYPTILLLNDGGGIFTDSGNRFNPTIAASFGVGDLDGDSDLDVFVSNMDLPNEVWLNDGNGYFIDSDLRLGDIPPDSYSTKPSLGDLDGDGDLDVFVGSLIGKPEIWINTISSGEGASETNEIYLGQVPPGTEMEVFAPGIVSIEEGKEYKIAISPDLSEIFFTRRTPGGRDDRLWTSRVENGQLTMPELAPFGVDCLESDAVFASDGSQLYYNSWRFLSGGEGCGQMHNMWVVDKIGDGWSEPQPLGSPIEQYQPVYFSIADDGTLYFTCSMPRAICYAEYQGGQYDHVKQMPHEINYLDDVAHPAIAPDESYIIVDSYIVSGGRLVGYLYISFQKPDGFWTKAVSMREALNATETDVHASPRITPDGKYLFFESYLLETDQADIYWISTAVIEKIRAEVLP